MAEGIRVGIGSKRVYYGEVTLASTTKTITLPNPIGNASKVERVLIYNQSHNDDYERGIILAVAFPKAGKVIEMEYSSNSAITPSFTIQRKDKTAVTVSNTEIVINTVRNMYPETFRWEVTCVD